MSITRESLKESVSKILLGELSRTAISALLALLNLPALIVLVAGKIQVTLQELSSKPIVEWQWYIWFLLASLLLTYSFGVFWLAIYIHKAKARKRTFHIFPHRGYMWKMWLLPKREIRSGLPLCPKHGVELKIYIKSDKSHKCPFCDISISFQDYDDPSIVEEAFMVGEAILDHHYKPPKEKS